MQATSKNKMKATISAVLIHPDGTRQDLGEIAGNRSIRQKVRAWFLRQKMLRNEARRKRNG